METPADTRIRTVSSSPSGHISPSGMDEYKKALKGNASVFLDWRRNPMTRKVLHAISDAALHLPNELSNEDRLVQYGMTQGLVFALQLISDPSTVWPGVFGKNTNEVAQVTMPLMDFDTSIDDVMSQQNT